MKLGLQIYSFTWPGGPEAIGPTLARSVRTADEVGFDSIWVMDHFWQIGSPGSELQPMLEGWTTLGFMAAHTPTGPPRADGRRRPLPQPRAVGQGRDDPRRPVGRPGLARDRRRLEPGRVAGPRVSLAETSERYEMLEDTLRIAHGMWQGERGSEEEFRGRQFHAARLLNVPQSISRPRVPILIGGGGERKTLRLVAQFADASNLFGGPDVLVSKYQVLAEHCAAVGRDFTEIERTNMQGVGLGSGGAWSQAAESPDAIVERFGRLAEAGVQHVIVNFAEANDPALIELLGSKVLPQLRDVEAADPRTIAATV